MWHVARHSTYLTHSPRTIIRYFWISKGSQIALFGNSMPCVQTNAVNSPVLESQVLRWSFLHWPPKYFLWVFDFWTSRKTIVAQHTSYLSTNARTKGLLLLKTQCKAHKSIIHFQKRKMNCRNWLKDVKIFILNVKGLHTIWVARETWEARNKCL